MQICRNVATQSKSGARCSNDLQSRSICARTSELAGYHSENASIANRRIVWISVGRAKSRPDKFQSRSSVRFGAMIILNMT